jgi:hypothetical protein
LDCTLSGVGSIRASGTANSETVHVQGLGSFNGGDLHSQEASVNLDGMGSATVWADNNLNANVDGMGSVNYFGAAQVIKAINGLGSIKSLGGK